jgi:hypothetical protein
MFGSILNCSWLLQSHRQYVQFIFLKKNVGRFNVMDSILSINNVANSKKSAAPLMQYAGPNREHCASNSRAPLGPFNSINKIFESTIGGPVKVFGSFLKRNVVTLC